MDIYTDGACKNNPGKGGWAFIVVRNNEIVMQKFASVAETTNNRMELCAVLEAIKHLETTNGFLNRESYNIFVDSKYVYDGITSWISQWKKRDWKTSSNKQVLNIDFWKELDYFSTQYKNNLRWNWVKAHNGNLYNEIVDKLASNAAEQAHLT